MKRLFSVTLGLALVALAVSAAQAQRGQRQRGGPGGGGFAFGPLMLLSQKSVQEELKLTEDQVKKVSELREKQQEALKGVQREERRKKSEELAKGNETAVAEILKPDQAKRLKQITLQQQGSRAFSNPEVALALKLTDEQKDKIKTIQEDTRKDAEELFKGGRSEENRAKLGALRKETDVKLTSLLTAEQKTKWKELTGEPFKGEIQRPGGNRPGGGKRRSNNNNT